MGCSRGVPGLFRAVPGCSGGVPGVFRGVPGCSGGVPGCSGGVPGVFRGVPGVFRVLQTPPTAGQRVALCLHESISTFLRKKHIF